MFTNKITDNWTSFFSRKKNRHCLSFVFLESSKYRYNYKYCRFAESSFIGSGMIWNFSMIIGSADFLETQIAKLAVMENVSQLCLLHSHSLYSFLPKPCFVYFEETVWIKWSSETFFQVYWCIFRWRFHWLLTVLDLRTSHKTIKLLLSSWKSCHDNHTGVHITN